MTEYKVISGSPQHVQTVLNQWRHDYTLAIRGTAVWAERLHVIVERTKKVKVENNIPYEKTRTGLGY